MTDTIALYRKFGLHASADALQAKLTCRTCVHKDSDAKLDPCATCRDFASWQGVEPVTFDETREHAAFDAFMTRTAPRAWRTEYDLARRAWMERAKGAA
jgi:hypothetical protein